MQGVWKCSKSRSVNMDSGFFSGKKHSDWEVTGCHRSLGSMNRTANVMRSDLGVICFKITTRSGLNGY